MVRKAFSHAQGGSGKKTDAQPSTHASHAQVRKLAIAAMFIALEFILVFTPIGLIPLGIVSITILHVPVIIAVLMEGMVTGGIAAFTFGALSLYKAISAPGIIDQLFRNPLISIVPRLMIVPAAYFAFALSKRIAGRIAKRRNKEEKAGTKLAYGIAAGAGSLANTVFTVGALSIAIWMHPQSIGITAEAVQTFLYGLWAAITVNSLLECAACVIIVTGIAFALERVKRTQLH